MDVHLVWDAGFVVQKRHTVGHIQHARRQRVAWRVVERVRLQKQRPGSMTKKEESNFRRHVMRGGSSQRPENKLTDTMITTTSTTMMGMNTRKKKPFKSLWNSRKRFVTSA